MLERALGMSQDSSAPCPTVLTTHKERNVTFYARAGFAVVDERELRLRQAVPYRVWGMEKSGLPRGVIESVPSGITG